MRIGVFGASGRIGTRLVELTLASPGLELAAALVSPRSRLIGTAIDGGSIEYRPAEAAIRSHCDVMIDFSTPAASLALQEEIGAKPIPTVIGTTGFTPEDERRLAGFARYRPLLASVNFAAGFEAFRHAVTAFAARVPDAEPMLSETYPVRETARPSATSQLLARELLEERSRAMGIRVTRPAIAVQRAGENVSVNEVRFSLGSCEATFDFRVQSLAAHAEGAMAAAQWLVSRAPGPGLYSLADSLTH